MGKVIVAIAIFFVAGILCAGLYTLWKGGATAATWSNRLMRLRVLAQAIAVLIIMIVLYFSQLMGIALGCSAHDVGLQRCLVHVEPLLAEKEIAYA